MLQFLAAVIVVTFHCVIPVTDTAIVAFHSVLPLIGAVIVTLFLVCSQEALLSHPV